ncbi:transglycosylase-like protein with SLT domain [Lutibacter sp. Hel_I_33_5]|uniref:lytic transglycosylase domain-containing protein n=1 Tax=Lutibacter sp. Hel_I_33_5 TaxID=1566289 RepID=UPI0011A3700A|nr:lytic transglycosylase domain-containing protein [Lutibacter sp. Hel_I_33_5]TVZ55126.1 transglycosylase-like protein with SLT domain [Lutibacter sp. Hel_I_33_5]
MKKSVRYLSIVSLLLITILFFNVIGVKNIPFLKNVSEKYEIKALKLPNNLNLAGERVPIERENIRERMDRELLVNTYWQSNGLLLLKRANKYFPILEPLLRKYGLPDDFKYLAMAESGFTDETSSAGAAGMWHFMKGTGREYGLEINKNVDERYHIEKATKVAARYLKRSKKRFGTWTLAAAAYNAGNAGVARRLKAQKVSSYYDVLLHKETERYVFRIVALKEIISNPEKYGFVYDKEDLYTLPETYTIEIDSAITNIASFAKKFGTNYKQLKIHNPWLRENKLNNKSRKLYDIKIPVK